MLEVIPETGAIESAVIELVGLKSQFDLDQFLLNVHMSGKSGTSLIFTSLEH